MNKAGTAYVLWLGILFGVGGLHRLYNGKIVTGLLWLFTYGFFGIGQLVDLLLIPNMVDEHNFKLQARYGVDPTGLPNGQPTIQQVVYRKPEQAALQHDQLMVQLLKAAEARGGKLSIAQGVLETGATFTEVEAALREMVLHGYVEMDGTSTRSILIPEFKPNPNQLMVQLLQAAEARGGKLSVTQGVMETGADFATVEAALNWMVKTGYVDISNDAETGIVLYEFHEL